MPEGIVPPPDLFWAALGVFNPGRESTLLGARREGARTELRYASTEGREVHYTVEGERIVQVDLLEGGHAVHRVTLAYSNDQRHPGEANYRNLSARRELRLTTRSIEHVAPFPTDIWFPEP
jgi:hypothetical protein